MEDNKLIIIVKAANQSVKDQRIESDAEWTVLQLKKHISKMHPANPSVSEQKLIYSGQLMLDNLPLRDVLRHVSHDNTYTVHLVCSHTRLTDTQQPINTSATPVDQQYYLAGNSSASADNVMASDGIRHRHVMEEPITTTTNESVTTPHPSLSPTAPNNPWGQYPMSSTFATDHAQQMAQMQQMYTQYITTYMQYMQMGGGVGGPSDGFVSFSLPPQAPPVSLPSAPIPPTTTSPSANPAPPLQADDLPPRAPPAPPMQQENPAPQGQNRQLRMNAQGGVADDEEDGAAPHDWLDYLYVGSRMLILLSFIYFYSTLLRFVVVVSTVILIQAYQCGWLYFLRRAEEVADWWEGQEGGRGREARQEEVADDEEEQPPAVEELEEPNNNISNNNNNNEVPLEVLNENQQQDELQQQQQQEEEELQVPPFPEVLQEMANPNPDAAPPTQDLPAEELVRPSMIELTWTFLTSFFASLVPERAELI